MKEETGVYVRLVDDQSEWHFTEYRTYQTLCGKTIKGGKGIERIAKRLHEMAAVCQACANHHKEEN